jgi:hypothetical protein
VVVVVAACWLLAAAWLLVQHAACASSRLVSPVHGIPRVRSLIFLFFLKKKNVVQCLRPAKELDGALRP